jgi:formylglycine-generating enzyme required for sulfatase activity
VSEWCADWFDEGYYGRSPAADPVCQDGAQRIRVMRGGSWLPDGRYYRAARRLKGIPDVGCFFVGFRVVLCLD